MNAALISALAALSGSAMGGVAPIVTNYLIQRSATERELLTQELRERQTLYSEFIKFGVPLYVDVTTKNPNQEKVEDLVQLYALVSRIRLYASAPVIEAAQAFAALVTQRYGAAGISLDELRNAAIAPHIDPLHAFSDRCREELREIFRHRSPVIS